MFASSLSNFLHRIGQIPARIRQGIDARLKAGRVWPTAAPPDSGAPFHEAP